RHGAVADPGDLSHPEGFISSQLCAGGTHHADIPDDGVGSSARSGALYGPPASAVLARRWHGIYAHRAGASLNRPELRFTPVCFGISGHRLSRVSSGVVPGSANGLRWAAWAGTVAVSGRRKRWISHRSAVGR